MDQFELERKIMALQAALEEKTNQCSLLKQAVGSVKLSYEDKQPLETRCHFRCLLPGKILKKIFKYLDIDSLVEVLDVCKAWRKIAFDLRRWGTTALCLDSDWRSVARTLAKAPCVQFLYLRADVLRKCPSSVLDILLYHSCPMVQLTISNDGEDVPSWIPSLLFSHANHLRCLKLVGSFDGYAEEIWSLIGSMKLLDMLEIFDSSSKCELMQFKSSKMVRNAWKLKYLSIETESSPTGGVLDFIIEASSDTLQEVELPIRGAGHLVGLLGKCPNLTSASIPATVDISLLRGCENLASLRVFNEEDVEYVDELIGLILHSRSLKHLSLYNILCFSEGQNRSRHLMEALAKSQSKLLSFSIGLQDSEGDLVQHVNDLLRRQPEMEELRIRGALCSKEELGALSPNIAPNLLNLEISVICDDCSTDDDCLVPVMRLLEQRNVQIEWSGEVNCHRQM